MVFARKGVACQQEGGVATVAVLEKEACRRLDGNGEEWLAARETRNFGGRRWTVTLRLYNSRIWNLNRLIGTESTKPRQKGVIGTGWLKTEAEYYFRLQVLREPSQKSRQKLQKCHRIIICFGCRKIEAYKAK